MFIEKADLEDNFDGNILDDITQFDDNKIDRAISYAITFVKSYLAARYDVDLIFAATGDDRSEEVIDCCVTVALYRLHRLINPRKVPEFRKDNYNETKQWLKDVQAALINPTLPVPEGGGKDYFRSGGNPKRNNYI